MVLAVTTHPSVSILSLHYPPEPTGNAPYTGSLAAELAARGVRVVAHVGQPHYPEWKFRPGYEQWSRVENVEGVEVHRRRHYVPRPPRGVRRLLSELSFGLRLLFARIRAEDRVVVVTPALFAAAVVLLRLKLRPTRRVFVWVQDIYTLGLAETGQGGGAIGSVTRRVERWVMRRADTVVVIHERFAKYVTESLSVEGSRVAVIRNWTHLPAAPSVSRDEARVALGWPRDQRLVVHTGNMGSKQGLANVIDAAKKAEQGGLRLKFMLVGDGAERQALEVRAEGCSAIEFVDPLSAELYPLALAAADILLVNEKPGVAEMAVPSKLTSYFNSGRPVVAATDLGGITASEIHAAGAGMVIAAGDPAALVAAVWSMTDAEGAAFGESGLRFRENQLDVVRAVDRWLQLLS
ncbi:glycosyltransferase family 4 protein [Microbacterium sp. MRS-1]|uniref:glycosyltransferase family 4 protein n=1 Tax=Microbacterium sp. MRS-1 TaxID=1451261 RepID=UPI000565DC99|nr:glycosyltransferase [Microbacterium sp. MRS-1]